jgi:predicted alpha/beta-fold hydrolase
MQPFPHAFTPPVPLGGNALLKWAEQEDSARDVVQAIAAVCALLDLTAAGQAAAGFQPGRRSAFVTLKANSRAKLARFPGLSTNGACWRQELYDFDDAVTAPVHGFKDAADYWRRASSKPWLSGVRLPALAERAQRPLPAAPGPAGPQQVAA